MWRWRRRANPNKSATRQIAGLYKPEEMIEEETAPPNPPPTARDRRRVPTGEPGEPVRPSPFTVRRPTPMESAPAPGVVVVFDFDRTIIDWDSDDWVITKLGAADAFQRLRPTMRWNPLMDRMMAGLHARGKTVEDIRDCLRRAPLDAHVISAIKTAASLGCDLKVVSDANTFFIETVLAHHGVLGCFSEISTNPASVDADGRLRISPFHDSASTPHGCSLCPENMCKGKIIEKIQEKAGTKDQHFIYIGDGKGDYCPSLKLGEGDCVMPKENYPLWNLICSNKHLLKAEVHPWNSGEELEKTLLKLVNRMITPPAQVSPFDCSKCEMSKPASTEVGHHQALHVPH